MAHERHPDPLPYLNARHLEDLLTIEKALGSHPDAISVRADSADSEGIDLAVQTPGGSVRDRISFAVPLPDYPQGVRAAFLELRRRAGGTPSR